MALVTSSTQQQAMAPITRPTQLTLLTLPYEIRLQIYEYLLHDEYGPHCITADVPYRVNWSGYECNLLSLLLVCRQFHNEIAPLVYRRVRVGDDGFEPSMWIDFFRMIGPTNASYIKDLVITYHCERDHSYFQTGYGFHHLSTSAELWRALLDTMYEAWVQPRRITLLVESCYSALGLMAFERCNTWKDLDFLRSFTWLFGRVEEVTIGGDFNPLWVYALKARFGLRVTCRGRNDVEKISEDTAEESTKESADHVWWPTVDYHNKLGWRGTLFTPCSKSHYEDYVVLELPDKE
ncbi:Altered inheritance of mitochondria protein 24, mitochondrial [Hypoxylon texense]